MICSGPAPWFSPASASSQTPTAVRPTLQVFKNPKFNTFTINNDHTAEAGHVRLVLPDCVRHVPAQ